MKKIIQFILALVFIIANANAQNQQIIVGKNYENPNEITLVAERGTSTTIKFNLNELNLMEVETDYGWANTISSANATIMLEAGSPELFYLPTAIIIPDVGSSELEITYGDYIEFNEIEIVPSKGNLSRQINPETVPYVKGDVYNQDAFFPGTIASLREPFIMRDIRGQSLEVYPIQYNPVTKILRVYSEITVKVNYTDKPGVNEFIHQKRHQTIEPEFAAMYNRLFINHSVMQQRGYPTGEEGEILIICHTAFVDAMMPYVNWKRTIGRKTTIVSTATTGTTAPAIKTYISNFYNNPTNNLAYVLLVGDSPQLPPHTTAVCSRLSDVIYGQLVGTDPYLEVLVGRMSAETVAQVQTQVERTIWYERDINTTDTWLSNGIGLASSEQPTGGHDGNEADYIHMNNIRNRMLTYGYNTVYQEYVGDCPGVPNTTLTQISSRFNSGVSIANYCNHGSENSWAMRNYPAATYLQYTNTQVNALQNIGKLPFVFSVACVNGKFTWTSGPCFAEAWMRATYNNQPAGAIATFMAWENLSWQPPMSAQDEFVNIIMDLPSPYSGTQPGTKRTIAGAMLNASQKMIMRHGITQPTVCNSNTLNARTDFDTWIVFGDPSLMFRTKTPETMTVAHNTTLPSTATSLSVASVAGTLAALSYIGADNHVVILGSAITQSNNIAVINFTMPATPPEMLRIAVTGFNKVTYLGNVEVTAPQPQLCEKPVGLSGSATENTANINWNPPINIDGTLIGYSVYRDGVRIGETLPSVRTYTDSSLENGTYIYNVGAKYEHCPESELSEGITIVVFVPQHCEPPVDLSATVSDNNVTITWNEPVNIDGELMGYNVYRNGVIIAETSHLEREYNDTNLDNDTYIYMISAKYEHCPESELSDGETVVVFVPQFCEKPTELSGIDEEKNAIITWSEPQNIDGNLLGYKIYKDGIFLYEVQRNENEFIDADLENGTYKYQISALYEHCEESELTDEVTVTINYVGINEIQTNVYQVFPNPATHEITITGEGVHTLTIFDITGRELSTYQLIPTSSHQTVDVSNLPSGTYFLQVKSFQGTYTHKTVKL